MKIVTILSLLASIAAQLNAQTILIDFSDASGTTPGNWNNITSPTDTTTITSLIDSTGADSGIDFQLTTAFNGTSDTVGLEPTDISTPFTAYNDSFRTRNSSDLVGAFTLSNLTANTSYDIDIFSSRTGNASRALQISFSGDLAVTPSPLVVVTADNTTYRDFSFTTDSTASSSITVTFTAWDTGTNMPATGTAARGGELNALELTIVPEPSTYAVILGVGALVFVMIRRRLKAN